MKHYYLGLTAVAVLLFFYIFIFQPFYPLYRARKIVQDRTPELVEEAKTIKDALPNGVYWGEYPPIIESLWPQYISTNERYGQAVEIMLTGGLYHSGIVVVIDNDNFNPEEIPFKVEQLNESVYAFQETGW